MPKNSRKLQLFWLAVGYIDISVSYADFYTRKFYMIMRVLDWIVISRPISLVYVGMQYAGVIRVERVSNSVFMICTVCLWDGSGEWREEMKWNERIHEWEEKL